jgi:hypothetical protein
MMQRGAVADEFFQIAHGDAWGEPRLAERTCALALAAALLAELVFFRRLVVESGRVRVIAGATPVDVLSHAVLQQIVDEPEHDSLPVRLQSLSHDAYSTVAHRLWQAGKVEQRVSRSLLAGRRTVTWKPVNTAQAAWTRMRLSQLLSRGDPLDHIDRFLLALAAATGLRSLLLDGATRDAHAYLDAVLTAPHPALRELLDHTQAAVGRAVLSHRT